MMWVVILLCVGVVTGLPYHDLFTPRPGETCGYESCTQDEEGMLNVHIVPHTHDDVGWLKTVDQYYYGSRNNIQKAGVQYILDTVVKELWEDPKRRFIYVETFFFWKWWMKQTDSVRHKVHTLVRQGRLQFVGGAWSMNDEAAVHYQSTVDQFTWGLSKLNQTFGACGIPRVGWQIDPFGHSREFASLLAGMAYDGLFLGRIDYQDKSHRLKELNMEMVWRGDDDLGKPSDIFTGILYNTYSPPAGFCFDILCQDEPIIDERESPMYNVDQRVRDFLAAVDHQQTWYRTPNILMTMGGDFTYQDAGMYFKNLDKLIEYTNLKAAKDGLKIKLFYSTPDCYLHTVKKANPTLPTKQDDFFPYASDSTSFWTGYFTSRPTTKYFEREGNSYLQMAKQLQVLAGLEDHNRFVLNELKSAMGIMQHHDAITGTEKQHVAHDYERLLDNAIEDANIIPRQAFNKFMQGDALKQPIFSYDRCRLNESSCATSETSDQFVVTVYNHLAWNVNESIRIPVVTGEYAVYAPNGEQIVSQNVGLPEAVLKIPTRTSKATQEVVFIAYLHPLSYKSYYIKKIHNLIKRDTLDVDKNEKDTLAITQNKKDAMAILKNDKDMLAIPQSDKDVLVILKNDNDALAIADNDALAILKNEHTHKNDKRKNDYYENVNDYWKKMKRLSFDLKNVDSDFEVDERKWADLKMPQEPTFESINDFKLENIDVMKDNKEEYNRDIEQLERTITDARKLIDERAKPELSFPNLSEEEMRMLGDDPLVVERFTEDTYLENQHLKLRINGTSNEVLVLSLPDGTDMKLNFKYAYYPACVGNNAMPLNRSSGAYIFRPNATTPTNIPMTYTKGATGEVVKEITGTSNENFASTIRLYDGLNFIEHDWVVGPINIDDGIGKEYIVRYVTDIVNNGEFSTDSNGRQMLKRKLFQRPQWNVTLAEPIAGNYYPVTNKIYIEDNDARLAVLTDRSEGGTSLEEGKVELMLHRRLLHDDAFGVGEALNETANGLGLVVRGRHRIFVAKENDKDKYIEEKKQGIQFHLQPQVFISDAKNLSLESWLKLKNSFSWANELPKGLHLLTIEPWQGKTMLLRLENYLELTDRQNTTIEIDLREIFKTVTVKSFKETTLAANRWLDEKNDWSWKKEEEFVPNFNAAYGNTEKQDAINVAHENDDGFIIKIKAKQIRTFVVDYEFK